MASDDGLFIKLIARLLPYLTLLLCFVLYKNYKSYSYYKYFVLYLLVIIIFDLLAQFIFMRDNITLYNVYTFFEFNLFALIFYHLIREKTRLIVLKILMIAFNIVYFFSFYFDFYILYTIPLEGVFNSIIVILFFVELLNSDDILNYKNLEILNFQCPMQTQTTRCQFLYKNYLFGCIRFYQTQVLLFVLFV